MDRLLSMRVFQKVIDEGGFASAARVLDMSPAGVTRRMRPCNTMAWGEPPMVSRSASLSQVAKRMI